MRRGVKRPRSRASNGAIAASRSTVVRLKRHPSRSTVCCFIHTLACMLLVNRCGQISNGEVMDVYDPIWDDVCCSCNNQNVTLADRSLKVAPCGHKLYVALLRALLSPLERPLFTSSCTRLLLVLPLFCRSLSLSVTICRSLLLHLSHSLCASTATAAQPVRIVSSPRAVAVHVE